MRKWYGLREKLRRVDEEIRYSRYNANDCVDVVEVDLREKSRMMGEQLHRSKKCTLRRGEDPKVQALAAGGHGFKPIRM